MAHVADSLRSPHHDAQVEDMGGWLNPNHVLFGAVNYWSGGAYQAFVQRMLMGVTLVKDVVEKSR